ncbi:hypothetical protein [Candidatus Hodgkinia cicadicola]
MKWFKPSLSIKINSLVCCTNILNNRIVMDNKFKLSLNRCIRWN